MRAFNLFPLNSIVRENDGISMIICISIYLATMIITGIAMGLLCALFWWAYVAKIIIIIAGLLVELYCLIGLAIAAYTFYHNR